MNESTDRQSSRTRNDPGQDATPLTGREQGTSGAQEPPKRSVLSEGLADNTSHLPDVPGMEPVEEKGIGLTSNGDPEIDTPVHNPEPETPQIPLPRKQEGEA